jgi:hypothetical protein
MAECKEAFGLAKLDEGLSPVNAMFPKVLEALLLVRSR